MTRIEKIQKELQTRELDAIVLFSEPNVRYASEFAFTDGAVAVTRTGAVLITDSRYVEAAEAEAKGTAVRCISSEKGLYAHLKEALDGCARIGAEEDSLPYSGWTALGKELGRDLLPAGALMTALRAVKDQREVDAITAAQRIAEQAFEEMLGFLRPGLTEKQIAAELTYRMMRLGGEGNSFDPITITGANTSKPHGVPGDAVVQAGDFVTLDFGTIVGGYRSDMTRTVAIGSATDEMRKVYDTVLQAQLAGIALMTAEHSGADVHSAAAKVIADAGYGDYFGHGFGHSVGLEIHEAPGAHPRNGDKLPVGAVVTAEPGIYLPGRFGVRIEDMVVIGADAPNDITKAPKELIIVK